MNFLDEPNLRSVADALWVNQPIGRASVMIGAGFSKNAVPATTNISNKKTFPGWSELTEAMAHELYSSPDDKSRLQKALQLASSTSGSLRIADEYRAWKGRGKLDKLLKQTIPDGEYKPGKLHQLLFRLPWSDVLTTNFDTLLERAAENEIDRSYSIIRSQLDIPGSMKPRIVKLHGSFPDTKPFVITEDDFRTYERDNQAMVNLVQQCFVENTTCLLGFSGDDPNFLRWTGWVRDVLGQSHMEPIYLVGLFGHSPAQRALLEERYVRSIDLAPLFPKTKWLDDGKRHQAATEWFLRALANLRPFDLRKWPYNPQSEPSQQLTTDLPEFPSLIDEELKTEYWNASSIELPEEQKNDQNADYSELTPDQQINYSINLVNMHNARAEGDALHKRIDFIHDVWKHNRMRYPGWLVLPEENRIELERNTLDWVNPISLSCLQVEPSKAFDWLFELQWRLDKCLISWPHKLISSVAHLLAEHKKNENKHTNKLNLELLRAYREHGKHNEFEALSNQIQKSLDLDIENSAFYMHQLILAYLETWRVNEAEELLSTWDVSNIDPIWRARKAVLLGEINHKSAADEAFIALKEIQLIRGHNNLPARSREAEINWAASVLSSLQSVQRQNLAIRRDQLRSMGYGSYELQAEFSSAISIKPRNPSDGLNRKDWKKPSEVECAFMLRRYAEITASLLHRPGVKALGSSMSNAVSWIAQENPIAALRLSIRNREKNSNSELLKLTNLAKISSEDIVVIFEEILKTIVSLSKRLQKFAGEHQYQSLTNELEQHNPAETGNWLLQSALQHLIDISPVLNENQRKNSIEAIMKVRKNWKNGQWQTWGQIETTLEALFDQCSEKTIEKLLPEIIKQPIVGFDTDGSSPTIVHDVFARSCQPELNISKINTYPHTYRIDELFLGLNNHQSISVKTRIAMRLSLLSNWGKFNKKASKKLTKLITQLIISTANDENQSSIDYFFDFYNLLYLPNIFQEGNKSHIAATIATTDWPVQIRRKNDGTIASIIGDLDRNNPIVLASNLTRELWLDENRQLSWSDWTTEEVLSLLDSSEIWWDREGRELWVHSAEEPAPFRRQNLIVKKFIEFCRKVVLPHSMTNHEIADKALSILKKLEGNGVETLSIISIHLFAQDKFCIDDISMKLRKAASSLEPSKSFAFLIGILAWISNHKERGAPLPPQDLIDEIAISVRSRRAPELWWAIQISETLLRKYPEVTSQGFRSELLIGLEYLIIETDINNPVLDTSHQQGSIENIRGSCVDLISALQPFPEAKEAVKAWVKKSDIEKVDTIKTSFNNLKAALMSCSEGFIDKTL